MSHLCWSTSLDFDSQRRSSAGRIGHVEFLGLDPRQSWSSASHAKLFVDRLIQPVPERDRTAGDRVNVDVLLTKQHGTRDSANEPNTYRADDIRFHSCSPAQCSAGSSGQKRSAATYAGNPLRAVSEGESWANHHKTIDFASRRSTASSRNRRERRQDRSLPLRNGSRVQGRVRGECLLHRCAATECRVFDSTCPYDPTQICMRTIWVRRLGSRACNPATRLPPARAA